MIKQIIGSGALVGTMFGFSTAAHAHVCNVLLSNPATTSVCGGGDEPAESFTPVVQRDGTVVFTDSEFTGYGWAAGTNATLGDSHSLDSGKFYVFQLARRSQVTITFANGVGNASPLDAAFSLYSGWLPSEAHDDAAFDPLNPVDDLTFLPIASPTDANSSPRYRYSILDKWRDTLRYSQTGGLGADGSPLHPFIGQFNAVNDWSMANEDAVPGQAPGANWSTIKFIAQQNTCGAGRTETLTTTLAAGKYTIAAGGANCNDSDPASSCRLGPFYSGTVGLKVR